MKSKIIKNKSLLYLLGFLTLFILSCSGGGDKPNIGLFSVQITSSNSTTFAEGTDNTFTITATGTPRPTFSITGTMPSGVTLDPTTGVLSGIPSSGSNGTYPLVITASNGIFSPTQNFTLTVSAPIFQQKIVDAVNAAMAAADNKRGISVAVYDGINTWTYAAGYADGEYGTTVGTPMTKDTPTYAYSITKTLVSALVLTQIEGGLYSLDDTVDDLLSGNADYIALSAGQKARLNTAATVEQLLTHTSGMPNYAANLTPLITMCNPAVSWKPVDILEYVVFEDFVPAWIGTQPYHYSNTNYILLGMIAEELGGAPLNTLLAVNFFTPLTITAYLGPLDGYPLNIAHPYDDAHALSVLFADGTFTDYSVTLPAFFPGYDIYLGIGRGTWAAGGIIATATEIAKWGYQLYDPDGLAITTTIRTQLKNSATVDGAYGYGVNYNNFTYTNGTVGSLYGHGGGAPGYLTLLRYETNKRISVAILTNFNNSDGGMGSDFVDREALVAAILNAY